MHLSVFIELRVDQCKVMNKSKSIEFYIMYYHTVSISYAIPSQSVLQGISAERTRIVNQVQHPS